MNIVYRARVLLINIGKMLPFVMCAFVALSYAESFLSILTNNVVEWNGYAIPKCSVSWFIGRYFEYDFITLAAFVVLSISTETCLYNRIACLYLAVNLAEKSYFDFELEPLTIYIICAVNIAVSGYLTFRGIRILLNK